MPIRSGTVSYRRFRIAPAAGQAGDAKASGAASGATGGFGGAADDALLATLAENTLRPPSVGAPPEIQAGFVAGRHVLDETFEPGICAFGSRVVAGVRVDINRMPPELRRAYRAIEEQSRSVSSPTGFLSRGERRQAREEADRRCERELAEGKHRRSRLIPFVWSLADELLLAPISGERMAQAVRELFESALGVRVQSRSAGSLAWDLLADRGLASALDDTQPSRFSSPPAAHSSTQGGSHQGGSAPEVPWADASPEPKDFLGNEFLMWLWCVAETDEGLIETPSSSAGGVGEVAIVIDRTLELDCAWGITGRTTLRGEAPTRLAEATKALQHGKWLRKCGLLISAGGQQWQLDLHGDRFAISSAILPPIEKAETQREELEQRVALALELDRVLVAMYETFLRIRVGRAWDGWRERISEWISDRAAGRAIGAVPVSDEPRELEGATADELESVA